MCVCVSLREGGEKSGSGEGTERREGVVERGTELQLLCGIILAVCLAVLALPSC